MLESELIDECKKYNPIAQRVVYKKYYSSLLRKSNRYLSDIDDAKDVLQEAFLKIFSNITKFKGEGTFEGWMTRIVINHSLTFLRKKNRSATESLSTYQETDLDGNSIKEYEFENAEKQTFTEEELLNAILELPENLRSVFNLACIDEYSHKEIASLLNISEENSRIRLMKARQLLKKQLLFKKSQPKSIYDGR